MSDPRIKQESPMYVVVDVNVFQCAPLRDQLSNYTLAREAAATHGFNALLCATSCRTGRVLCTPRCVVSMRSSARPAVEQEDSCVG